MAWGICGAPGAVSAEAVGTLAVGLNRVADPLADGAFGGVVAVDLWAIGWIEPGEAVSGVLAGGNLGFGVGDDVAQRRQGGTRHWRLGLDAGRLVGSSDKAQALDGHGIAVLFRDSCHGVSQSPFGSVFSPFRLADEDRGQGTCTPLGSQSSPESLRIAPLRRT